MTRYEVEFMMLVFSDFQVPMAGASFFFLAWHKFCAASEEKVNKITESNNRTFNVLTFSR